MNRKRLFGLYASDDAFVGGSLYTIEVRDAIVLEARVAALEQVLSNIFLFKRAEKVKTCFDRGGHKN